jgi:hypothetical protein
MNGAEPDRKASLGINIAFKVTIILKSLLVKIREVVFITEAQGSTKMTLGQC